MHVLNVEHFTFGFRCPLHLSYSSFCRSWFSLLFELSWYCTRRQAQAHIKLKKTTHSSCWGRWKQWVPHAENIGKPVYEGWNFNSGNYLFTTDTK